jgi:hypothetical protein
MAPRRWPLLAVAGAALLMAAVQLARTGTLDAPAGIIAGAGLIMLGAWLAMEIKDRGDGDG